MNKEIWDYYQVNARELFMVSKPRLDYVSKKISRYFSGSNVLEIGIGDGYLLKKVARNNKAFGIDISEENVNITKDDFRKKNITVELRVGTITTLPYPSEFFHCVVVSEVLEHLESDVLENGLREIRRVLKKGGFLIGTVPADENLRDNEVFCPNCKNIFHKWGHIQAFDKNKISKLIKSSELSLHKIKRLSFYVVHFKEYSLVNSIKYLSGKLLYFLFKRVFASQWNYFFIGIK